MDSKKLEEIKDNINDCVVLLIKANRSFTAVAETCRAMHEKLLKYKEELKEDEGVRDLCNAFLTELDKFKNIIKGL